MDANRRQWLVRVAAPVAFLLVATIAILLVRSSLHHGSAAPHKATVTRKHHRPARTIVPVAGTTTQAAPPAATTRKTYTVASGDTLGSIAAKQGTTVDALLQANPGITPTNMQIGDTITLP
jgi:LysM repeat protein